MSNNCTLRQAVLFAHDASDDASSDVQVWINSIFVFFCFARSETTSVFDEKRGVQTLKLLVASKLVTELILRWTFFGDIFGVEFSVTFLSFCFYYWTWDPCQVYKEQYAESIFEGIHVRRSQNMKSIRTFSRFSVSRNPTCDPSDVQPLKWI